ncbi:DUF590-domain-containing protein [Myriangium duriaei CBS 260.36]|uniref:DUF590-domain-containing protein n=1 Tax=Myriangium duriaei CBS 260.36 TaxID=1168546 RepID=A0A9P4J0H6_9PEZI|nr:DUF590-domain-containing protein [Myriangium duriaei CBS 260.36]
MASPTREKDSEAALGNMGVDYVISFRFVDTEKEKALARFNKLVEKLAAVGLTTEVRQGDSHSLLIFVRVSSEDHINGEAYRSRVNDWIHGIRAAAPEKETRQSLESEPLTEGERLRIIHRLISNSEAEGGAGITVKDGEWENVESIFALHDNAYNKAWIKRMSSKYILTPEDLDEIRDRLGENIAFYFAFMQSYFTFLIAPASFGGAAWLLLGKFSPLYAIASTLWTIVFVEWWRHQEYDLAVKWGVKGVSKIQTKRRQFAHETEMTDPVTGETIKAFPAQKRLARQLLTVPFAFAAIGLLGSLIAIAFAIEIFISEIYSGPLKWVLVFLPTGILTTGLPILTGIMTSVASRLTDFENYETDAAHETAMTQKIFILNFITSYLGIFLTAFVYIPFGCLIVPYLDVFKVTVSAFAEHDGQLKAPKAGFQIDPDRLRKQVIYFTVTAQIVNQGMEVVLPYVKRKLFNKYKKFQSERAAKNGGALPEPSENDHPEEAAFLARVRAESELDIYDVTDDLREMVLQFGHLALHSVVWPLTGISFLVNNWIELRTDAIKICVEMQRPTPSRRDTIGPWLDSLSFLSWIGAVSTSALVYMFDDEKGGPDGRPDKIKAWGLLLTIIFSEHLYLLTRWVVQIGISKLDTPGRQKERKDRFLVRKMYFEESLNELKQRPTMSDLGAEAITRQSLEEEARQASLKTSTPESRFWNRQRNWKETAEIGKRLISAAAPEAKKEK